MLIVLIASVVLLIAAITMYPPQVVERIIENVYLTTADAERLCSWNIYYEGHYEDLYKSTKHAGTYFVVRERAITQKFNKERAYKWCCDSGNYGCIKKEFKEFLKGEKNDRDNHNSGVS